ncbi:LysM peptidoglycan-binding domain-containing protein, partial [Micrococcus sp. F3Y]|uniref:LysM peptidoglycan-binding domain-containing protein n=1 Tax=Micrococcus sp. F3Y TaxID=3402627 RepID=UPI003AF46DC6
QCIADARGDIGDAATLYRYGTLTVTNLAGKKVPADRAYADRFTAAAAAWERVLPALTYTVKPGDTLFSIARTHGTNVDTILALNPGITDPNMIQPLQVINLA